MRNAKRVVFCIGSGLAWGALAYGLGAKSMGEAVWASIISSPFVGVAIGFTTHSLFVRAEGGARWFVALLTLYFSGALFALAAGAYQFSQDGRWERIVETQVGIAWGITMTGFFIVLWPLAFATHLALEAVEQR